MLTCFLEESARGCNQRMSEIIIFEWGRESEVNSPCYSDKVGWRRELGVHIRSANQDQSVPEPPDTLRNNTGDEWQLSETNKKSDFRRLWCYSNTVCWSSTVSSSSYVSVLCELHWKVVAQTDEGSGFWCQRRGTSKGQGDTRILTILRVSLETRRPDTAIRPLTCKLP